MQQRLKFLPIITENINQHTLIKQSVTRLLFSILSVIYILTMLSLANAVLANAQFYIAFSYNGTMSSLFIFIILQETKQ